LRRHTTDRARVAYGRQRTSQPSRTGCPALAKPARCQTMAAWRAHTTGVCKAQRVWVAKGRCEGPHTVPRKAVERAAPVACAAGTGRCCTGLLPQHSRPATEPASQQGRDQPIRALFSRPWRFVPAPAVVVPLASSEGKAGCERGMNTGKRGPWAIKKRDRRHAGGSAKSCLFQCLQTQPTTATRTDPAASSARTCSGHCGRHSTATSGRLVSTAG
jgi:hypothetical protein